jgi:hypothetical protein
MRVAPAAVSPGHAKSHEQFGVKKQIFGRWKQDDRLEAPSMGAGSVTISEGCPFRFEPFFWVGRLPSLSGLAGASAAVTALGVSGRSTERLSLMRYRPKNGENLT